MEKELKDPLLTCNTSWVARKALKKLKHTVTVKDYIKEFNSLMLDVHNMSKEDKLFNFFSSLQPWTQIELIRRGVKDLPMTVAAADALADYHFINTPSSMEEKKEENGKRPEAYCKFKKNFNKGKGKLSQSSSSNSAHVG